MLPGPLASGWLASGSRAFDRRLAAWHWGARLLRPIQGPAAAEFHRHESRNFTEVLMAKPEWGTKRRCLSCGAAFYDLSKQPILCPKCGAEHHPEQLLKPKRGRPEEKAPAPAPKPKKAVPVDPDLDIETEAAEDEEEFIEDASELGEDEDDVAEVIEGGEEGAPDEER